MAETPRLHLVGGFLGSGKTTAIINAARLLSAKGLRVGVVTNDQGKYLVDTAFFRLANLPAVEVTGGCFCCNYSDLEEQLGRLQAQARPDVIFAESVGSCADLVATVIRPLTRLNGGPFTPASFSVFVDARLLRLRLAGEPLPFSDDVVYIFDQQIEEAGTLVINKCDLLEAPAAARLAAMAGDRFPGRAILQQDSLQPGGAAGWLEGIESGRAPVSSRALNIDYTRYGAGEMRLAWLDAELLLQAPSGKARAAALAVLRQVMLRLHDRHAPIGHLKFFLADRQGSQAKISFTALNGSRWEEDVPPLGGSEVRLLVNARVEIPEAELERLVQSAASEAMTVLGGKSTPLMVEHFHPAYPKPEHRMQDSEA